MITKAKNVIQYKIKSTIKRFVFKNKQNRLRKKILKYYSEEPTSDIEISNSIEYLSNHRLSTYYGDFQEK